MNTTTDVWFAAFLESQGKVMESFEIIRHGKGKFNYEIEEEEWKQLKLKFNQSVELDCRNRIEKIKNLIY